jgi:hypothetical protein
VSQLNHAAQAHYHASTLRKVKKNRNNYDTVEHKIH